MNSALARSSVRMAAASMRHPAVQQRGASSVWLRQYSTKQRQNKEQKQAEGDSKTWFWIPAGVGLTYIALQRLYHIETDLSEEQKQKQQQQAVHGVGVTGPWQLHVLSALPLKAMSRLFGSFNELEIPTPLRSPLLRLYAWIFGCNLGEMKDPELRHYPNLSTFFYRELCDGARPVDAQAEVVSPSDGKVLHFGVVQQRQVEQVKGLTYSLDAFLGEPDFPARHGHPGIAEDTMEKAASTNANNAASDDRFAVVNGIPYTLDGMIGSGDALAPAAQTLGRDAKGKLCFCVIYLAPGDYHRFHSPANWIVEARRHFAGELYSVSPYIARTIQNLFVLNERVALLGKWSHGFMSMTAVGATNVGSVVINFDKDLRTNLKEQPLPPGTFSQLSYKSLPNSLSGVPLASGQEVGGFKLGSTVVLVFEAPDSFAFDVKPGQTVRMGQALGHIH